MKTTKTMTTLALSIGMVASMVPVVANATIVKNTVIENSDITTETTEAKEHKVLCEIFMVEGNKPEDVLALIGADGTDYILSEDGTMFTCAITEEQAIKAKFCELVKCFQLNFSGNNDTPEHTVVYPSYPAESDTESVVITAKTYDCEIVKGDANCDGIVNMADAVTIMQNMANPNKYPISEQGRINGDIDENGLTNADAQAIQLMILNVIRNSSETEDSDDKTDLSSSESAVVNTSAAIVEYEEISRDYPYYDSLSSLANKANQVFSGRINKVSFEVLDMRTMKPIEDGEISQWAMLFTVYEIEAEEVYAGSPISVKLRIEGGIPDGYEREQIALLGNAKIPVMKEFPALTIGTKYLFALYHADGAEYSSILNPMQSIYSENAVSTGEFSIEEIKAYYSWTARKIFDNGEYSESVVLSAEETGLIKNYCYGCKYETGTADCINDYEFTMENGAKIYYHSDCGTFNDNTNELSYNTTDYMRDEINMILGEKSFWQLCQGVPLKNS